MSAFASKSVATAASVLMLTALSVGVSGCPESTHSPHTDVTIDVPTGDDGGTADTEPDASPDTSPDTSPDSGPDTAPDTTPDTSPDTTPDATPDATPDTTPDTVVDVAPDVPADVVPDTPGDGGGDAGPDVPDIPPPPQNSCLPGGSGPSFMVSGRADLRWRRIVTLQNDLKAALDLNDQQLCDELGLVANVGLTGVCYTTLHLVPLGGNDPVFAAMYDPIPEPGATSALALDRVVVSACGARVDLDTAQAMSADGDADKLVVFKHINLASDALNADDSGVDEQIQELYQRFHSRDATAQEIEAIKTLTEPLDGQPVTPREFAKTACFTIATLTEAVFH